MDHEFAPTMRSETAHSRGGKHRALALGLGSPLRILMVHDSAGDAALLVHELERGGYETYHERVETPEDMRRALEGGGWDAILSAHAVPGLDVREALGILRERSLDIPVIVVPDETGEGIAIEAMRSGARDYVMKGSLRRLCPAVEREVREARVRRERRRSEEALRQSEELYRTVTEQTSQCVFLVDALSKRLLEANAAFRELLGYSPEELEWMTIYDLVAHSRASVDEDTWLALKKDRRNFGERSYRRKDGSLAHVEVSASVISRGGREALCISAHDVGKRKRAEEALRESEERYRVVAETASDAIIMIDEDSRILFANGAAEDVFGYTREEMLGEPLTILMPHRLRHAHRASLERYVATGRRHLDWKAVQLTGRRKDGKEVPLEISFGEYSKDSAKIVIGFVRDITERKRAEEALRMSETRYRSVIEQSPLSIQILSPRGQTLRVNKAWEDLWGVTLDDLAGYNLLEDQQLVDKGIMPYVLKGFAGEPTPIPPVAYDPEETIPGLTGNAESERWVRAFIYPVKDEAGNVREVTLMHEDITEHRRAEESLRESEDRLRMAVEATELGTWDYNPVTGELGWDDRCKELFGLPPEAEVDYDTFLARLHPDDRERTERLIGLALDPDGSGGYGTEYRTVGLEEGVERGVYATGRAFFEGTDEERRANRFIGTVLDITKRKKAEEQLRESEERFQRLAEEVVEGIVLTENGGVIDANKSFALMFGYEPDEVAGMRTTDLVVPEDRATVARRISVGDMEPYETRGLRKDGTTFPLEVRPRRIPYHGRQVRVASLIDLTDRKEAEEALATRASQQAAVADLGRYALTGVELSAVMDETVALVARILDVELCAILEFLPDGAGLLLRSGVGCKEGIVGGSVCDLGDGRTDPSGGRATAEYPDAETRFECAPLLREHGAVSGASVTVHGKEGAFGVLAAYSRKERGFGSEDVDFLRAVANVLSAATERKRAEELLDEAKESERRRIAAELHDQVLQDLIHALSETQLLRVRQMTTGEAWEEAEVEGVIESLRRSVEGLRAAIFELRKRESLENSFVSAIESLVELNRRMSRKRYEVHLSVEGDFPDAMPARIGRAFARIIQEALSNARRHSSASKIWVTLSADGDEVSAEVADDGRGFDVGGARGGVGISEMRQRAQNAGVELEIGSIVGSGTIVRLRGTANRLLGG